MEPLQGFAVGADNGTVVLFDRESDDKLYRKGRSVVAVGHPHAIRSIACSPSEESLACSLDNCCMLSLNLANAETIKVSIHIPPNCLVHILHGTWILQPHRNWLVRGYAQVSFWVITCSSNGSYCFGLCTHAHAGGC